MVVRYHFLDEEKHGARESFKIAKLSLYSAGATDYEQQKSVSGCFLVHRSLGLGSATFGHPPWISTADTFLQMFLTKELCFLEN